MPRKDSIVYVYIYTTISLSIHLLVDFKRNLNALLGVQKYNNEASFLEAYRHSFKHSSSPCSAYLTFNPFGHHGY